RRHDRHRRHLVEVLPRAGPNRHLPGRREDAGIGGVRVRGAAIGAERAAGAGLTCLQRDCRRARAEPLMPGTVIIGTHWGDEGKGQFTDYLSKESDLVVRYHAGHNAGHTVSVGGDVYTLQLVPSGVLYPHVTPVIGNGVVVEPAVLIGEL